MKRGRKPRLPWDTVDWSLSNRAISENLGCAKPTVVQMRQQLGKPKVKAWGTRRAMPPINREGNRRSLQWGHMFKCAAEGKDFKIVGDVEKIKIAVERIRQKIMNTRKEYDSADWSKSDAEIARDMGVTRQSVTAARLVRGIKSSKGHGGLRSGAGRKAETPSEPANAECTNPEGCQ